MFDRIHRNELKEFRAWLKTVKIKHTNSAIKRFINYRLRGMRKKCQWIIFSPEFRYVAVAYNTKRKPRYRIEL